MLITPDNRHKTAVKPVMRPMFIMEPQRLVMVVGFKQGFLDLFMMFLGSPDLVYNGVESVFVIGFVFHYSLCSVGFG